MTDDEIEQFILNNIPCTIENGGLTNKYYMIRVNKIFSLELAVVNDAKFKRYRLINYKDQHRITGNICEKDDFVDCLYFIDFLYNGTASSCR